MDMFPTRALPVLLAGFLLASCSLLPHRDPAPPPADTGDADADLVYHALAADISARRGQLVDAFAHYVWLARETQDVDAAEKAAKIGLHINKNGDTLMAAALWAELAPDDLGAHEVRAALYLDEGLEDEAYRALRDLVEAGNAKSGRGYTEAAGVIAGSENRDLGGALMARLVSENPKNAEAHYAHALVLLTFGDLAAAQRAVSESLRLNAYEERAWLLYSRIVERSGSEQQSGAVLKKAVAENPRSEVLRIAYARWLVEAHHYDAAFVEFKRLLQANPDDSDILFALGALATDLERWTEARAYWGRLLGLGERVDEARYFLAQVEEESGHEDKALELYRGVQGGPLQMEAGIRVADLLARRGDLAMARRVIAEQRVLFPEHAVTLYQIEAELVAEHGSSSEVSAIYDTALGAFPGNPELLYARAMHAAAEQRLDASERDLRTILRQDPDHADALNALGYTLVEQSDRYQEAFELISRALKLKPESAAVLDSMGWVNYRLGNLEAALDYLRRAAEKDGNSEIAAHLGEVLWASGRREEALKVWKDALGRDPEDPYLRETMERLGTPVP